MKIFPQIISVLMNESINDAGVCRTAPATPGLLNIYYIKRFRSIENFLLYFRRHFSMSRSVIQVMLPAITPHGGMASNTI